MFVLALTGLHGSGKGVLTNELTTNHNFVVSSFSSTAKRFALEYDPFVDSHDAHLLDIVIERGWTYAKSIPSVRSFLNDLGKALSAIDPQYVLRKARADVEAAHASGHHIVFDDCYTLAEGALIRELGGMIVHVAPFYDVAAPSSADVFQNELPTPDETVINLGHEGSLHGSANWIVSLLERRTLAS